MIILTYILFLVKRLWPRVLILMLTLYCMHRGQAQTTYTWVGPDGGDWTVASHWSPQRDILRNSDIIVFDTGGELTVNNVPSQAISGFNVINSTNLTLNTEVESQNLSIRNSPGLDFLIEENSSLRINGTSRFRITLAGNTTGEINGELILGDLGNLRTSGANCILTINGKIKNEAGSFSSTNAEKVFFGPNSEMEHARNHGSLPSATWDPTSTVLITGMQGNTTGNNAQLFGNVIFRSPDMTVNMTFSPLGIQGDLIIDNEGATGQIRQGRDIYEIGGNMSVLGGAYVVGNTRDDTRTIQVNGDLIVSGGTLLMTRPNNALGIIEVAGDLLHEGGLITQQRSGRGRIVFTGDGTPQNFVSNGTVSNRIDFYISPGSYLLGNSADTHFFGAGDFLLDDHATLGIKNPDGIEVSGTSGMVRVTGSRDFSSQANYVYAGDQDQIPGNGLPDLINSLTIDNQGPTGDNTLVLTKDVLVSENVSVLGGNLDLSDFSLNRQTEGGNFLLANEAGLIIGDNSSFPGSFQAYELNCESTVIYNGTNQDVTNPIAPAIYGILMLSGSGVKTFPIGLNKICSDLILDGPTQVTAVQELEIGNNLVVGPDASFIGGNFTHSVQGDWIVFGTFDAGESLVLFDGDQPQTISGGDFHQLEISGSGLKTITGNVSIAESGNIFGSAAIEDGVQLSVAEGAKFTVASSGSLTAVGTGLVQLLPRVKYLNYSTSNPQLEVQQELQGSPGWRMMGSPVGTTYADFLGNLESQGFPGSGHPTLQPNVLWFDETDSGTSLQAWRMPTQVSDAVPGGRGHYLFVFDGQERPDGGNYQDNLPLVTNTTGAEPNLASGIFDFTVTSTERDTLFVANGTNLTEVNVGDQGFNLVSNPTASYLDFFASSGWTKTNLDNTIYVWDPTSNNFLTHNGLVGTLEDGILAPYQAFWVKTNAAGPVLRLENNDPKTDEEIEFLGRKSNQEPFAISLQLLGEGMESNAFISFGREGSIGHDRYDAYQLESLSSNWLFLYTYGSVDEKLPLVINHQNFFGEEEERVIPLHMAASRGGKAIKGSYLLNWDLPADWPSDKKIVLMDHQSKKAIDMREDTSHAFSLQTPNHLNLSARVNDQFHLPKAVMFQSPFSNDEAAARKSPHRPFRPFTIYIGSGNTNQQVEYLPDLPKLFAPYPNPFENRVKIRFYLPGAMSAEVRIYDTMGQLHALFPNQEYATGIHELDWESTNSHLPKGIYIVRLTADQYSFTQKLIKK